MRQIDAVIEACEISWEKRSMQSDFWLEKVPLWGVLLLTIITVFVMVCIGSFLGSQSRKRQTLHDEASSFGTITGATLALLAFMLAFSFGIAAERLQTRKKLLLEEVNTIETTYLRAGLIDEPHQTEMRNLIVEYVDLRASFSREKNVKKQLEMLPDVLRRSEALHSEMWTHAVGLSEAEEDSEIDALFIDSLNSLIDYHTNRVTVGQYRIPEPIWYVLIFMIAVSMVTVGYQAGFSGKQHIKLGIVLALTFSSAFFLIADLDRTSGSLKVIQTPMFDLQYRLQTYIEGKGHQSTPVPETQSSN